MNKPRKTQFSAVTEIRYSESDSPDRSDSTVSALQNDVSGQLDSVMSGDPLEDGALENLPRVGFDNDDEDTLTTNRGLPSRGPASAELEAIEAEQHLKGDYHQASPTAEIRAVEAERIARLDRDCLVAAIATQAEATQTDPAEVIAKALSSEESEE